MSRLRTDGRTTRTAVGVVGVVGVVVPPLLSLLLRRHRIGEIDPDTVASLLIHLLWDRLDSGRYRGPPLVQVLRRHH